MTDYRPGIDDADYLRNAIRTAIGRAEFCQVPYIAIVPDDRVPGYGFRLIPVKLDGFPIDADLEGRIFRALVANGYAKPSLLEAG